MTGTNICQSPQNTSTYILPAQNVLVSTNNPEQKQGWGEEPFGSESRSQHFKSTPLPRQQGKVLGGHGVPAGEGGAARWAAGPACHSATCKEPSLMNQSPFPAKTPLLHCSVPAPWRGPKASSGSGPGQNIIKQEVTASPWPALH